MRLSASYSITANRNRKEQRSAKKERINKANNKMERAPYNRIGKLGKLGKLEYCTDDFRTGYGYGKIVLSK